MIIGLLIGLVAGLAISAVVLSTACKLVGVKPPAFFPAMVICFFVMVGAFAAPLLVSVALAAASGAGALTSEVELGALVSRAAPFAVVLQPFVSAGIYCVALEECSFGRGLLVWLGQLVVIFLFCLVLAGIGLAFKSLG
jgi:hypothetical protein